MAVLSGLLRRPPITWGDALDVAIVAVVVYELLILFRGTRAIQMALSAASIGGLFFLSQSLGLETVNWLIRNMGPYVVFAVIVLFQSDIRRALAHFGRGPFFRFFDRQQHTEETIEELVVAAESLSARRVGAIGVVAQMPNFNRVLKKHDVDFEILTAGKYKRTLTMFGENTDEDREKLREEIEEAHELFKTFVSEHREQVDLNAISTGEHWYGRRALELNLIDKLETSDDYLLAAGADASLLEITYVRHKPLIEKWFSSAAKVVRRTVAETQGGAAGPSV